jgi:ABC-type transporter Mla subunit MlaD
MQKIFKSLMAIALTSLMAILITFNAAPAQALTLNSSLVAATTEEVLTNAAQKFLTSLLNDYTDKTQDAFDGNLKAAKKTVSNLTTLLEKAEKDGKNVNQAKLAQVIKDSQKQLAELATSFNGLAQKTEDYDNNLENTLENLLKLSRGKVKENFNANENAFKGIAQAISSLADDTDKAAQGKNLFELVGDIGGHIKTLNQAINVADKALKAFAG